MAERNFGCKLQHFSEMKKLLIYRKVFLFIILYYLPTESSTEFILFAKIYIHKNKIVTFAKWINTNYTFAVHFIRYTCTFVDNQTADHVAGSAMHKILQIQVKSLSYCSCTSHYGKNVISVMLTEAWDGLAWVFQNLLIS